MSTNLFRNPDLAGSYKPIADAPIALPTDWKVSWVEKPPTEPGQTDAWKRPVIAVTSGVVEILLGNGPLWCAFYEEVALVKGATYKVTFGIRPSPRHPDAATVAGDPLSVEARLFGGAVFSDWSTGVQLPSDKKTNFSINFVADRDTPLAVGIEVRGRHSLFQNLFALSAPVLELVSDPSVPAGSVASSEKAEATQLLNIAFAQMNLAQIQMDAARTNIQSLSALIDRVLK